VSDSPLPTADLELLAGFPVHRPSRVVHLERPVPWVWDGYLALGSVTLLTGWWKLGKSTLVSALLSRLGAGGDLGGRPVAAGRALVVTEEELGPWLRRFARFGIGDWAGFVCNPFTENPVARQWGSLFKGFAEYRREYGVNVVVLDTLAALLPGGEESNARAMTAALRPVRDLAADGVAVLLVHHPRKGARAGGQAARGTGALPACVDIVLEYDWAGPPTAENRRRRLLAWSRHPGTPREVVLELDAAGTGYTVVPPDQAEFDETTRITLDLVRAAPGLTARQAYQSWPAAGPRPAPRRVQEVLQRLTEAGHLARTGRPHPSDPYRYYPPADTPAGDTPTGLVGASPGPILDPSSAVSRPLLDPLSAGSQPVLDPSGRRTLHDLTEAERAAPAGFSAGDVLTARELAERYGVSERVAARLCAEWATAGAVTVEDASTKGRRYRVAG
jgi:hypothetical protein